MTTPASADIESSRSTAKRPTRTSSGRRSVDMMVAQALRTGAAGSVGDLLDQVARIPDRALFNALLAVLQLPHATLLCSAERWERRWGRRVVPEQRPLVLMYPFGPVEFVFDLSQTEPIEGARQRPLGAEPFAMDPIANAAEAVGKLRTAVGDLGVRVVNARQGVLLAGHIRRHDNGGLLRLADRDPRVGLREVPVRWVVSLNESHRPTEELATLTHELGHLLCGHVGADRDDPWPSREDLVLEMREFEAESVARLVFRRIAPTATLPPYLEHLLKPGEPLPDAGWTYVVQAADRVLGLILDSTRIAR